MKVSEFIEQLQALPQDAEILVPAYDDCRGAYWDAVTRVEYRTVEMFSGEAMAAVTINDLSEE